MADTRQVGSLWTPEEDVILLQHVARYGTKHWGSLQTSGTLPHRDQKACCNRFILLKRKFFQARAKGQNLQSIFPYISSQPQSPSVVASHMLHPSAPPMAEVSLRVNASSRVICKRVAVPSPVKPALLQSVLTTVQDQTTYGGISVDSAWMPTLVDAQLSPAASDPSSPVADHGSLSLMEQHTQKQQQQQLQQLLFTIGQSANAVSQAAAQFVNASSVNPNALSAAPGSQQQQQAHSAAMAVEQQSAADAVVNMILRKIAGEAGTFVSDSPSTSATTLPSPILDAASRPSSSALRRPSLLSAPAVVPSAGAFSVNSGGSSHQVVPGSGGVDAESESEDDMVLAYLHAQGQAKASADAQADAEAKALARAGENKAVAVAQQQQQQRNEGAPLVQEDLTAAAAAAASAAAEADMSLLLQLHEEVMALEKLVAASAPSTASPAGVSTTSVPPLAAPGSLPSAAAPDATFAKSLPQRPDAFLDQMSSAPGRMLFGFSPVYDLMTPSGAAADADAMWSSNGWDLRELVDASAFYVGASGALLL